MTEIIKNEGGKETELEYFAILVSISLVIRCRKFTYHKDCPSVQDLLLFHYVTFIDPNYIYSAVIISNSSPDSARVFLDDDFGVYRGNISVKRYSLPA